MSSPTFDIAAALKRLAAIFWHQFAPIVLLGLALMTLPSMLVHLLFGMVPPGEAGTWIQTFLALLGMVFAATVNAGVLMGGGVRPARFIRGGLAAARPGVVVALLIGAVSMTAVILRLVARLAGVTGGLPAALLFGALFWFLVAAFVAIPAAIVERLLPVPAIRRSFALTAGNRGRLAGFACIVVLALVPPAMLVDLVMFGADMTPESANATLRAMTLASPGLWIGELFSLLVCCFVAPAPAVAYQQLVGRR